MKIICANVNGIRSAERKGIFPWLVAQKADFICMQEVRADASIMTQPQMQLPGYHCYFTCAQKKGYSGVAIYAKHPTTMVSHQLGNDSFDVEGRYIHLEYDDLMVASVYFPSGSSHEYRQDYKYAFMDCFKQHLKQYEQSQKRIVICGDINIAHKEIDIKNWKANQKNSGFLPEERAWLDRWFDNESWFDAFRLKNQSADEYTWWSNRGRAYDNNAGWRIDYQVANHRLCDHVKAVSIFKDERFSDHAPLIIDYQ